MASQETTNNAAESATDRKENLVKPSAALPPGFRARPQGPPGSPRHPPNNGPVGQPRPGLGQPPQIRFENRAPLRPFGSGQFVQLRPHGQPRPPGNQLPQRPPQQGQNPAQQGQTPLQHSQYTPQQNQNPFQQSQNPLQKGQNPPIVLNPRFAPSPINRTGPQQSPRLPHPGNFQGQFPRNAHPPQHPGFEHPQRSPDVLGRPQEIAQRQLQRNESLLSFPQLSLPPQREDRKPPLPRIVVERMADVNSARKEQQLDNSISKEKLRENTENDDDDDVVIDGKKSPRPDSKESIIQSAKRPETATINGKVDAKPVSKPREELNGQTNNIAADKVESQTVKSAGSESRSPSAKLDQPRSENANTKVEDKLKVNDEKQNEKSETDKGNLSAGEKRTIASPTPSVTEDKPKSANESSNELKPSERELSVASPDQSLSSTPVKTSQKETGLKTPSKTPDKSRSTTPSESNENQKDHGLKTPTRSSENSRANTPAGSEQSLKTPSKSPDKSRASTPSDSIRSQNEDESKNKTSDKSRSPTPAKIDQAKENPESKPSEATSPEVNDNRQQSKTMYEESDKRENDSTAAKSEPETSENHEPAKDSSNEEQSKDSAPSESASGKPKSAGSTKSDSANISEDTSSENLQKPAEESKPASPNASLSTSAKETRTPVKSPVPSEDERKLSGAESMLPTLKTPEESVKGFDNGQIRSLSPKSPTLPSPKSPVSSKSLTGSAKSVESEKKRASFVESTTDQEMDASNAKTPSKPSTPRIQRAPTPAKLDEMLGKKIATGIENGNGMDESTVSNSIPATNGVEDSPTKKSPSKVKDADKRSTAGSPVKSPNKSIKSLPRTPDTPSSTAGQEKKKVPMNKVQVGAAPSPNLKTVRSKIGSLENTSYKPGGGKVKIENRKLDFSKAQPKIAAKNEKYTPSGGDKKISQVKLQWNAKSKIGSLENATYKPGGGDKKIETVKLDFKDKAKPKVGSKDNAKHTPGGGNVKSSATPPKTPQDTNNDIQTQKVDIKAESKIGSLDNVKHKPGGGEKKIFNDRDYLRQSGSNVESQCASGSQVEKVEEVNSLSTELLKENLPQPPPTTPTKIRKLPSPSSMVTPRAVRSGFAKSSDAAESKKNASPKETAKVASEKRKNLNLANIKDVADEKIAKSPSPEYPVNLRLKSPDKSSPNTPRQASPKNIRLPKLAPSPTPPETKPISETHSKISLPKLIEPSKQLNSFSH